MRLAACELMQKVAFSLPRCGKPETRPPTLLAERYVLAVCVLSRACFGFNQMASKQDPVDAPQGDQCPHTRTEFRPPPQSQVHVVLLPATALMAWADFQSQ